MDKDIILIPENYEEAKKRKEEVLRMINEYNEALFNEQALPYSDEEIKKLQEEYLLLDDYVELTETEKKAINNEDDDEEISVTDNPKKQEKGFWDLVNPLIFVYALAPLVGSMWFAIQGVGIQVLQLFTEILSKYKIQLTGVSDKGFLAICLGLIAIYPVLFCILTLLVKIFVCRKKETKKAALWILFGQILISVINYIVVAVEVSKQW